MGFVGRIKRWARNIYTVHVESINGVDTMVKTDFVFVLEGKSEKGACTS
jgi:hypothetical protein